jgi:O-antigen/teichoic acid export membrane protein
VELSGSAVRVGTKIPLHIWVAISSWVNRGIAVLVQLAIIPMLTRALGDQYFAAYVLVVSLLSWFALLDFGLGNALQNYVSEFKATGRSVGAHAAFVLLASFAIVAMGGTLVALLSPTVARILFAGIPSLEPQMGIAIVAVAGFGFVCFSVGNIGTKVLYALGRGVAANLLLIGTNLTVFAATWFAVSFARDNSKILAAVLAYSGPMGVIALIAAAAILWRLARWSKDGIKHAGVELTKRARRFWFLALVGACAYNLDYLIMSQTLKPQEIAVYNILSRSFGAGASLYAGLLTATWPVWAELAIARKWPEFASGLRTYLLSALSAAFLLTVAIIVLMPPLLPVLFGSLGVALSRSSIILFGIYVGLKAWMDTFAVALQSMNDMAILVKIAPVHAALSVAGQIIFSVFLGLDGILLGLILSSLLTAAWILPRRFRSRTA